MGRYIPDAIWVCCCMLPEAVLLTLCNILHGLWPMANGKILKLVSTVTLLLSVIRSIFLGGQFTRYLHLQTDVHNEIKLLTMPL